jgi:PiT family inorganic phosphate transporter
MTTVQISIYTLAFLVFLALAFDFMNGFHDAANSIATVVSTRVLKPQHAVLFAAFFNVAAIFVFDLKVAATIGKGIVDASLIDHYVIFGALIGALTWNIVTWYYGIPSSSSHALVGGMIGATVAKAGAGALISSGIIKILIFIILSPTIGFILGGLMMLLVGWMFRRKSPAKVDVWFRKLQLVSAAYYSLGHGANDAQKTMGIIWLLLLSAGVMSAGDKRPPDWVIYSCYLAIGLGTAFGGWRIVKTMGQKLAKLKPVGGFCAETGGAITLTLATLFGIPVSTTHTITGSIVGASSTYRAGSVRWGLATNIVWAWVLTIPASAFVAAIAWYLGKFIL